MASPSPTSLEEKDQETVTNEQHKLAETGTQEVNENLFLGSITNRELGRLPTTQPRGTKTTKDTTENKRSMLRPVNDDLGITDTARQRSEALGEAGSSTQRYNDQQLIASVMSKKKEQATRKGIIPKQNQDVSDTPSSASGGIIGKNITTKHQREFKNENKSPENFPSLRELEQEAMKDYNKAIGNMLTISKKKAGMVNDREEGAGYRRDETINEMSASKSLAILAILGKDEIKKLDITKMDMFSILLTTLKYRVDRAESSQRDMGRDPLKNTEEAIHLVQDTLSVTNKLIDILSLFYGKEINELIEQHEGILRDLEEMEEGRGITGNWLPSNPREIQSVFQWYWSHRAMLIEIEIHYATLMDIDKIMKHHGHHNIIQSRLKEAREKKKSKESFYDKCARAKDQVCIKEEFESDYDEVSQAQRYSNKRQLGKKEKTTEEIVRGYMNRSKTKDQSPTTKPTSSRPTYDDKEHVSDISKPTRKSTTKDKTEGIKSLSLNNLPIARTKLKDAYALDMESYPKSKDKSIKAKKDQDKKTRGHSHTHDSEPSDHEESYSVTCDDCKCTMFSHRASSGHRLICDCGHAWDHHTPVHTKPQKVSVRDFGRYTALSSDDSDNDDGATEDLVSVNSKNPLKKSKTKNWAKLYKFALKRGTEDFKISQSVIKIIFQSLRWGHHKINQGGGTEAKMVEAAPKVKAKIKPSKIGTSINVNEWIKLLNDETEDMCWPTWYRIQWVCKTGGLANDIENSYRDLIRTSLKIPADKLNDYDGYPYDRTHDREDQWYWDCMWIELLLWIIHNFHFPTSDNNVADVIKQQLKADLELIIDPDMASQDAYTREAQSVHFALQKAYRTAEESLSSLPSNPQYIFEFLIEVLKEKTAANEAPQGEIIARVLEHARLKFSLNPGGYITSRQPLSDKEIRAIKALGPSKLSEKHFKMITQSLMEKVRMGQPFYQLQNFGEIKNMQDFYAKKQEENKLKKRTNSKADSSEKTDLKATAEDDFEISTKKTKATLAKVNNAKVDDKSGDNTGIWDYYTTKNSDLTFEWEKGKPKCNTCGMAHSQIKGDCTWVEYVRGRPVIQTQVIAEYPNVFITRRNGVTIVRHHIISELVNHGFPTLGITSVNAQQRVVSNLKNLAKQATPSTTVTKKANNVKLEGKSKTKTTDDDDTSSSSMESSKESSENMAVMDEDYVVSGDSEDSGGRE